MSEHKVTIVGAGFIGCSLALGLAKQGWSVTIIDRSSCGQDGEEIKDPRITSLGQSSWQLLNRLEVADGIANPVKEVHVSHGLVGPKIEFAKRDTLLDSQGFIVINKKLLHAQYAELSKNPKVTFLPYSNLVGISPVKDGKRRVVVEHKGQLKFVDSALVVGADGAQSSIRKSAGIKLHKAKFDYKCVVMKGKFEKDSKDCCFELLKPSFALLPLPKTSTEYSNMQLIWMAEASFADKLLSLTDKEFSLAFLERFGLRLGALLEVGKRYGFKVNYQQTKSYAANRIALIGDAAHVVPPLGGQGANIGLRDVDTLLRLLKDPTKDPGTRMLLQKYHVTRKFFNTFHMLTIYIAMRVVGKKQFLFRLARSLIMNTINRQAWLRGFIGRRASGLKLTLFRPHNIIREQQLRSR